MSNKKSKSPAGIVILVVVALSFLTELIENTGDDTAAGVILALAGVAVAVAVVIMVGKNRKKDAQTVVHNHDRIGSPTVRETEKEHYRKQLDGFLKAGIIEKSEYRILMQKHGLY